MEIIIDIKISEKCNKWLWLVGVSVSGGFAPQGNP